MNKKITIAIDGFSSTGKSTIAKLLAKKYNYIYVDTGAMYRAVTLYCKNKDLVFSGLVKEKDIINALEHISLSFQYNESLGFAEMFLNGKNVESEIRTLGVSELVSKVAAISEVRRKLVSEQQIMGEESGVVMDGRDIGTVVFPNAELKLFMTASDKVRAQRRFDELISKGDVVTYEEVLHNVKERDYIDTHRESSPLLKASDAIEVDNSNLTIDEQFEKIIKLVNQASV